MVQAQQLGVAAAAHITSLWLLVTSYSNGGQIADASGTRDIVIKSMGLSQTFPGKVGAYVPIMNKMMLTVLTLMTLHIF